MIIFKVNRDTKSFTVKRITRSVQVNRVGKRGLPGDIGPQGPKGDPGDPASNLVTSVNGKQGIVVIDKSDVGLSNVPNTDFTAAVATNTAKRTYPLVDEQKLATIATGAEVNVNADWNAVSGDAFILNKPTIPVVDYPVTSVNGRTGAVIGLAEKAELDMVENELFQDLTDGDAATLTSANTYTDTKVAAIDFPVDSVAGKTGVVTLVKGDVGLSNVDNTSDANKPVSTATQTALNGKVDKVVGNSRVYINNGAGVVTSVAYSASPVGNAIAQYSPGGELMTGTPSTNASATSKLYVDTADALNVLKAGDTMTGVLTINAGNSSLNINNSSSTGVANAVFSASSRTYSLGSRGAGATYPNSFYIYDTTAGQYRLVVDTSGNIQLGGSGSNPPTHTLTLPSTATGISLYDTTDQTTNFARLRLNNTGGLFSLTSEVGGSTTIRGIQIGSATTVPLGFFGATPVVQQTTTTDLGVALSNLGLRAVGTNYSIATSGGVTLSGATDLTGRVSLGLSGYRSAVANRSASASLGIGSSLNSACDATTASFTITLPAANASNGQTFWFKKIDATANTVTIQRAGTDTIEGATTYVLSTQYKYVELVNNGSNTWFVRGNN